MSEWEGGLEPGKLKLNLMTLGFQGSPKERGVETSHCYPRISDLHLKLNFSL